ncbi:MAG: ROK family protein [Candidatus Krumholzibacteriota bacterium]|nr:ROK family protein [Candidatus Krumholzibacteriota bacterium]
MAERIIGIDIGGTNIKLGIVTPDGNVVEDIMIDTEPHRGPVDAADRVNRWYRSRLEDNPGIKAAGIACAGLVEEGGYLHNSPNLRKWEGTDLARIFSERLGLSVTVNNDVNCAAWGEYRAGAGAGSLHFVCITLGTGVGGGIVLGGHLYRGARGFAGEIGHQVIMAGGPECSCGNRGCLEALVGAGAIVARYQRINGDAGGADSDSGKITVRDISAAAAAGEKSALAALEETGRFLGIGLANVAHILNPEIIAIGGGVSGAGEMILGAARISMRECLIGDILSSVRVVAAELGNKASFIGAALLAQEERINEQA